VQELLSFFTDPIVRGPTIGCMLMCFSASLMGVIVFLRKQSLLGEALSHAAYPGIIAGVMFAGSLSFDEQESWISFFILCGAFCTAWLGIKMIHWLQEKWRVPPDAALCFILSTFFGIGVTATSEVQFSFTPLYRRALSYLYGQAATMTDIHIVLYSCLAFFVLCVVIFFYKELQIMTFDQNYAKSIGIPVKKIDALFFILIILSVVIGARSVGVVLMSAMLIAPAVAARQCSHNLALFFVWSAIFGLFSGFFGNYFSVQFTEILSQISPHARIALPTGPMIVLVATTICILTLLLSPTRGLFIRFCRIAYFQYTSTCENILKSVGRIDPDRSFSLDQIKKTQQISSLYLRWILWHMKRKGWIEQDNSSFFLTQSGKARSAKIIRLHRLWELYLSTYLGVEADRVHRSAEEMEHILTPELEQELSLLLVNPTQDPHHQPIPPP